MLYFPMGQDDNQKFPVALINYINTTWNTENKYFFAYMYEETSTRYRYYIELWDKTSTGTYYITPNANGYQFTVGFTNAITGAVFQGLSYYFDDERIVPATPSGTFPSKFNPANSSKYDNTISYLSNLKIYTQDGSTLMLDLPDTVSPDGYNFEIKNMWTHGTWYSDTQPQVSQVYYRHFRAKLVSGKFALYPYEAGSVQEGKLKMGIKNDAEFYEMQYSTNGIDWIDTETFPFDYFLRKRTIELGEFDYALTFSNNYIPVFNNETDAQGYINGTKEITDAANWADISNNYPILNATGSDDPQSDFGEVKTKGFFSQQYIMDATCLSSLSDDLFDTTPGGIWEAIKQGLDMYGDNPIDAVMGLSFWPVDLTSIFTTGGNAPYIWLGGYGWPVESGIAKKIIYPNGYISVGSTTIKRSFNSWRDMEPYTKLYVMLPYCGTYQLDLARYYDKQVEVRYYIDTRTNGCVACLIADGFLTDYFNGQMGVTMPITLTDYTSYMNAQINTLLGGGGQAVQQFGNAAGTLGNIAPMGNAAMLAGGAALGGVTGIAGAAIGAKMVYGLSQNNINNFNKTKGGSSSMINEYLPQSVCFIFEVQEDCAPPNYGDMLGYPSMQSGSIMNFSGFLKCHSVKLNCPVATEAEREKLKQMLLSGIYI